MNVSLPESLRSYVEEQVSARGYGTSSEYARDLIRRDQDREALRALLMAGAASPLGETADGAWFAKLRARASIRACLRGASKGYPPPPASSVAPTHLFRLTPSRPAAVATALCSGGSTRTTNWPG